MKQFTCDCLEEQFKQTDQVYLFEEQSVAEISCAYRPKKKVTLRRIRLDVNFCPHCGKQLNEVNGG